MMDFSQPHRRYNPLRDEWVLVSPHRTQRPWLGASETASSEARPQHDPNCYLCPGSVRANGERNPAYETTFVFENDFPALLQDTGMGDSLEGLLQAEPVQGECRVICFSPRHDLTLAQMSAVEIAGVVDIWVRQAAELGARYAWVQIFENKGETMGCSNPHPHGQIWASAHVPSELRREDAQQRNYWASSQRTLLGEYLERELKSGERIVLETQEWVWLVPFWAVWPFETMLLPKRHVPSLTDLDDRQRADLAEMLCQGLPIYDRLFETSFPYSMGWHFAPFGKEPSGHWQLHAHFYPPLLRSASVKKFMVGYEMLAEAQRDLTPEQAAERLRSCKR
jgi:UDPglucose--hexose-1-phosphate uridylyltransferase